MTVQSAHRLPINQATLTANWHADGFAMFIGYRDVDIGRKVAPIQVWHEIFIHVQCICVDVEFVT